VTTKQIHGREERATKAASHSRCPPRARQLAQINTYLRVFINSAIDLASASVTPTMPLL
jgi:hypothetical protein